MDAYALPAATHMAYAHLRVADLDRALAFYRDLLGLRALTASGSSAALSATGAPPPLIVLEAQPGARPRPPRTTGLYHVAIRLPDRATLARALRRLAEREWPLHGAADHGVSEALYLSDPDGNGLELYTDRPRAAWPWRNGQVAMVSEPLDVRALLSLAGESAEVIDPRADIGHVHLQVSDLARAEAFYCGLLGFEVTQRTYPGALFVAAGGYHHHLGLNIWAGHGAPPPPADAAGLVAFGLRLPDAASWEALRARLDSAGVSLDVQGDDGARRALLRDPDGTGVVLLSD
jgi:catechol 2,3-dioxygenase